MKNAQLKRGTLVAAFFLFVCFYFVGCTLVSKDDKSQDGTKTSDKSFSYNELYKKVSPSVVTIYSNFGPELLFDETVSAGSGSGVIFRQDGYIITNYHVVIDENYDLFSSIEVALRNGKTFVIGDPIFVIGSPGAGADLMLTTLTTGVVSAKDRTFPGIIRLQPNLIQIDAAINPGNSGGPVYDVKGRVVGIATLRDPETQNLGFAVPIDVAKRSADEIIKTGSLKRGWIGVDTVTLGRVTARAYQFEANEGAVVVYIYRDSPAAKGGMERGDVILTVDGKKLKTNTQLEDTLFKKEIGDSIELKIDRFGEEKSINLIVEEIPTGKLE